MEKPTLIHNPTFADDRGRFAPLELIFGEDKIEILRKDWIQSNISYNPKKHTFRGMHLQLEPYAQSKLVKVVNGGIIDFVVDLRKDSPSYMKVQHFVMDANNELLVPRGFAHGFITTEDNTVVQYLVDNEYSVSNERSIAWISFPEIKEIVNQFGPLMISTKDVAAMSIEEYLNTEVPEPEYRFDSNEWQGKSLENINTSYILVTIGGLAVLTILIVMAISKLINI